MSNSETGTLTFTFQGGYEVQALTVARTIENLVQLATEVSKSQHPDASIGLSVRAVRAGSLKFDFVAAAVQTAQTLFTPSNAEQAKNIVDTIQAFFQIKKHLKDKKPKDVQNSGEMIVVKAADSREITLPASAGIYFTNSKIDMSITNVFSGVAAVPGVTGIQVSADGAQGTSISQDEIKQCTTLMDIPEKETPEITTVRRNESLYIRKPDLAGTSQWGFISDKNFYADMQDESFVKNMQSGKISFQAKTYIIADLSVTVPIGENGLPDETKCRYAVIKVHEIHHSNDNAQTTL